MSGLRARSIGVLLTVAALWFVFASLKAVSSLEDQTRTVHSFAADQAGVLHTSATVAGLDFAKAKKFGGSTSAEVTWAGGQGSDHIYLSDSEDVRSQAPVGSRIPVAVWRGHVVRFEFADAWHTADGDPGVVLDDWRILVCAFTAGAVVCGRISAHLWLGKRVDHRRFLAGDLLMLPFLVAMVVMAATPHPARLAHLVPYTLATLVVSAIALPALPWMRASHKP